MQVKTHITVGVIVSILFLIFYSDISLFYISIFFLSTILIDVDHYFFYVYMTGEWNLKKSYNAFLNLPNPKDYKNTNKQILIFHGVESCMVLLILACLHPLFIYVCLGVALHMFLDLILIYDKGCPLYIKLSQILVFLDNKRSLENFK